MDAVGRGFVPAEFLPPGADEHYLRNARSTLSAEGLRRLTAGETDALSTGGNTCADWSAVLVSDPFCPELIKDCEFHGLIRIGRLERVCLEHHDLRVPVGISHSRIVSCDIGNNAAVHHVRHLAHYLIGDRVILLNVDEMHTSNRAKFGNGILKDGEEESVRIWMDLMNESGRRRVMPFDGMLAADAYLWARYRGDAHLLERLAEMTQRSFDSRRGFYGSVGPESVVKNSRIIKDVIIGPRAYVKGANKLKNLTVNSSNDEPTQIGDGVELVNGIVGRGCRVFYGCKAVRIVMGDNSTVSCCEILNNLIFPAHEQHHNNSFLIASLVMGQSNLAAAATIGSNHNSRAPDGEIQAGRGFWPGLCVSVKHNCRFASFTLLVKAHYPAEMDIPLPFSLVSNDAAGDRLLVLPAYWWSYNMYALVRNAWKFATRDKRRSKAQHVEFDYLAPDTAEEMLAARGLLEGWSARAWLRAAGQRDDLPEAELRELGRGMLTGPEGRTNDLEVLGEHIENSRRKVVILKARQGYHAYRRMLLYYGVKNLMDYLGAHPDQGLWEMAEALSGPRQHPWTDLGGQLVLQSDLDRIRRDIRCGMLDTWSAVHATYDRLWAQYPLDRQRHALATLLEVCGGTELTEDLWATFLEEAVQVRQYVAAQTLASRRKDHDDAFRRITFESAEEMRAVLGCVEEDEFVRQIRQETDEFVRTADRMREAVRQGVQAHSRQSLGK